MAATKQLRIDFQRGVKLRALDRLTIPAAALAEYVAQHGEKRGLLMRVKTVLKVIDSFAGDDSYCWASLATIAQRLGCCERNARYMLREAQRLGSCAAMGQDRQGLLIVTPAKHHSTAIHSINWNLALDWSADPAVEAALNQGGKQRQSGGQTTPSGGQTTPSGGQTTSVRGANNAPNPQVIRHDPQIETPLGGNGAWKDNGLAHARSARPMPSESSGGWPMPVNTKTLNQLSAIRTLWEHALAHAWATKNDWIRFVTLCRYCRRRELDGVVANCGAALTVNLRAKNWFGNHTDEEDAREVDRLIREGVLADGQT